MTVVHQFSLCDEYIALNKLLKAVGICDTGGQANILIQDGLVFVEGQRESRKRRKIKAGMSVVYADQVVKVVRAGSL